MSARPGEPDPNAYTLRPVLKGEPYSRAVEGGVRRTPAPADGLVLVLVEREVFLAEADLEVALRQIHTRFLGTLVTPGSGHR